MSLPCPRSNETHTYIYIYRHFYPTNFLPYLSVTKLTNFTNISETGPEAIRGYVSKQTNRSGQGPLYTSKCCMPDRDLALETSARALPRTMPGSAERVGHGDLRSVSCAVAWRSCRRFSTTWWRRFFGRSRHGFGTAGAGIEAFPLFVASTPPERGMRACRLCWRKASFPLRVTRS